MTVFRCKGCSKTFINNRALSSHLQHKTICKSIHYNLDFQTVINNWKQPKTIKDKALQRYQGEWITDTNPLKQLLPNNTSLKMKIFKKKQT